MSSLKDMICIIFTLTTLTTLLCTLSEATPASSEPFASSAERNSNNFIVRTPVARASTAELFSNSAVTVNSDDLPILPLWCGVHYDFVPGNGFNLCEGNWAIGDFCSSGRIGYPPLVDGHLQHKLLRYYPLPDTDEGIFIIKWQFEDDSGKCDSSSEPPASPAPCGDDCDPWCAQILQGLMNDCDTNTRSKKMGGTKMVQCDRWVISSVSKQTGDGFGGQNVYGGDDQDLKDCATVTYDR